MKTMKPKDILDTVEKITNEMQQMKQDGVNGNDMKIKLTNQYSDFSMKYPVIFLKTIEGNLNLKQFTEMVGMATNVNNKKISQHDASVKVGEKLVKKYVKPILKKNKK